jgi:hypothetical protein
MVRVLTEASPGDGLFMEAVRRLFGQHPAPLSHRRYAPAVSHCYLIDRDHLLRIPTVRLGGREPAMAILDYDGPRVEAQIARFEALWAEALPPFGPVLPGVSERHSRAWPATTVPIPPGTLGSRP